MVILKKVLDGCLYVLNLCITCLQGVGAVDQEEGRNALDIVESQTLALNAIFIAYANPRDGSGRGLPEVLVRVY